jgi:hypothetical protein
VYPLTKLLHYNITLFKDNRFFSLQTIIQRGAFCRSDFSPTMSYHSTWSSE